MENINTFIRGILSDGDFVGGGFCRGGVKGDFLVEPSSFPRKPSPNKLPTIYYLILNMLIIFLKI